MSRCFFWDRYWGRASQLLAIDFSLSIVTVSDASSVFCLFVCFFSRSLHNRHFAGKLVVTSRLSAVFLGYNIWGGFVFHKWGSVTVLSCSSSKRVKSSQFGISFVSRFNHS